jgi:hypothetical protein
MFEQRKYFVVYAGSQICESCREPVLGNGSANTAVARQLLFKHKVIPRLSLRSDARTMEKIWEAVFREAGDNSGILRKGKVRR